MSGFGDFGWDNIPEVKFEVNGESCVKIRKDLIEAYQVVLLKLN